MYLKKIEIQGFKSFANKTEIKFKNDITAIVGPNGSGKSNISDAIRWVLGEQSVKSLRGTKMEDVIFSGTDKRRALGFAEVSIYFNNEDKAIPIEYSEVVVTRRVFRSGESEYYINKNACRLKDIRTMFMDTGIGKDGYSIIGQGRIDEILSNKPEDRRNIFEEASEIVKYKSKKEEAERRIEKTRSNLDRIKDLIHEISCQEKSLKNDSQKANEFVILYEELKNLEINLHTREIFDLELKIEESEAYLLEIQGNIVDMEKEEAELRIYWEDLKKVIGEKEEAIEALREEKIKAIKDLEGAKNQKSLEREKDNFSKMELLRLEKEEDDIEEKINQLSIELDNIHIVKGEILEEYQNLDREHSSSKEKLEEKYEEILNLEEEVGKKYKILTSNQNREYELKTNLENLDSFNRSSEEKQGKLQSSIENISNNLRENNINLEESKESKRLVHGELNRHLDKKNDFLTKRDEIQSILNELEKEINNLQLKYQDHLSKHKLYKSMEDTYEGYYKGVKALLKEIGRSSELKTGYIGIVADLFKVEKKLEVAVDIALGGSLQNFVVEDQASAQKMIDYLKQNKLGRVTFLPINTIKSNLLSINLKDELGALGFGHEVLEYDKKYKNIFESLLARTIIVDNLNNGIKLANKFKHRYKIVTLEGEVLNPGGSLTGGSYKNNSLSIVSRKNRIKELGQNLKDMEILKKTLYNNKNQTLESFEELEAGIKNLDLLIAKIQEKIIDENNKFQAYENEININKRELKSLEEELSSLLKDSKDFTRDRFSYLQEREDLKGQVELLGKEIHLLEEDIKESKALKVEREEALTDLRIHRNEIENKIKNLEEDSKRKNHENNTLNIELENTKEEIIKIKTKMDLVEENSLVIDRTIEELETKDSSITDKLTKLVGEKDKVKFQYDLQYKKIEEIKTNLNLLEKKRNNIDLNLEKWNFKIDNYKDKLYEDYEIEYHSTRALDLRAINIKESRERISHLKTRIKSLGNVNVSAIEEYKGVSERLDFLKGQHTDLIDGKEDLEEIIKDMERKMRIQFMKSFKIINENFSIIFSKLFNGGSGSLELDSGEDILESGIQIRVQPPGKKLQNLNLLSGGEKSLTAVALLFAILKSKPSPFCILDEIDAALDEANITRYTEFLKQFNEDTQFILITHRKTTMEIANILYGVTMEEDGISQLISVKMEDDLEGLAS